MNSVTPLGEPSNLAKTRIGEAPQMAPLAPLTAPWIVSIRIHGNLVQQIWDGRAPLGIGQPFRWMLERTALGVRIHDLATPIGEIHPGKVRHLGLAVLSAEGGIELGAGVGLRITPKAALTGKVLTGAFAPSSPADALEANTIFKNSVRASLVGLAAFLVTAWLWPKPQSGGEDLVPAQYAQLVMPKVDDKAAPGKSTPAVEAQTNTAKASTKVVEKTAVVQAFRAKALKSAMSGLLKGGMTTLLAQSDFVMGDNASAQARRMLDAKDNALAPTAELTGLMQAKQVQVVAMGGAGGNFGGAKGVGYSQGEHAGVKGQGKSQISAKAMADTLGALVQEGLTKDEVGEVIHRHMSEIRYCYESTLIQVPDLEGKLLVNFTIGGTGDVKDSAVKTSTLTDPRLDDCVMRRLTSWKFPQTKGGIDVAVTYPFIFKMLGR